MSHDMMRVILDKIKEYDKIFIFRHFRPDGDAVGSSKGLQEIIKATWPEKEVYLANEDFSEFLDFLGPEDETVSDDLFTDGLAVVLDTATLARTSSKKHTLCREVIKIDHHIDVSPYGDLSWVESKCSSTCEMIVRFYDTFRDELVLNARAATYLYTGMVTDTGRFRYDGVNSDTLRYAALLLDYDIDTERIFAHLYLEDFALLKFKAHVYDKMQVTENGVAYLYIDKAMQDQFCLSLESAGNAVSYMETIKGCLSWIAFLETGDAEGTIRVRMRSRFAPINSIAEKYRGGGHAFACGATIYTMEEMRDLLKNTDALIKEYKASHKGWL